MLKRILIISFCGCLLFAACSTDKVAGSTETTNNKVGYKGLYGKLVDEGGKLVSGAGVKAISTGTTTLNKTTSRAAASSSDTDSVSTDDSGYYSFETLDSGTYNLQGDYDNGSLVVLITDIEYDSAGKVLEVATDTLRAPGQIVGRVITGTGDDGGVMCYIPGTSFLAITDDTGRFTLSNIPQGRYTITYRKEQLKIINDTGIEVRSGEKTVLPTKNMEADPAYPPPPPINLTASYDTLHGCVRLSWQRVAVSDLAGYAVYRNDTASSFPQRVNDKLAEDTVYFDTVFSDLNDTTDRVLYYRLKAQDEEANVSSVYSKAVSTDAPSPAKVRTFISLRTLNTIGDTVSINDTAALVAMYRNATRKNIMLEWFFANDSLIETVDDTPFTGSDTVLLSWSDTSVNRIHVAITDEGSSIWRDSISVIVVQDVPSVEAGADTAVSINTSVLFKGTVSQRFGRVAIYKWDFDGDGALDDSSTTTDNAAHTYTHEAEYTVRFFVCDDDGNEASDTLLVSVGNFPPKINAIRNDTTISIKDSIQLFGVAADTDGTIVEYSWDFDGNGTFDYTSATDIAAGYRYDIAGTYNAGLKVTDDDGKASLDTAVITVVRDVPIANAGNDTIFEAEDTAWLHGTAMQRFGSIAKWEWKVGSGDWSETGGPDTFFVTPPEVQTAVCSLAVTDDDGNGMTDAITILSFRKVKIVDAGAMHSLILKTDSTLWVSGWNAFSQLGFEEPGMQLYTPTLLMSGVQNISAGWAQTFIIKTDNSLWACGWNEYGQLGDGTLTTPPKAVNVMNDVKGVSAGQTHTLILKTDHTLWASGWNVIGVLGDSTTVNDTVVSPIYIMNDVQSMAAGPDYSLILKTDGTLWACGRNIFHLSGVIGEWTSTPAQVMNAVRSMAVDKNHALIIKMDGTLWACGRNESGQLGDGTTTDKQTLVQVMSDVQSATAGISYSMILKTDGTLWACGDNTSGQLGDGTRITRTTPVEVMTGVRSMVAGDAHNLIQKIDGTLWACGRNEGGQLGDRTVVDRLSPVRIVPPKE